MVIEQLKDFAANAQAKINNGSAEDKLRHYLSSRLISIFPDYPWWVRAHIEGTEEHVHFSTAQGNRSGFVDALVGKTAIEYEKNLEIQGLFNEGYYQVKEYCAALFNIGISETEILGVLSDTVRWYGYKVRIVGEIPNGQLCGPDNVELEQIYFVNLSIGTDEEYSHFEQFINQFMAREESRLLTTNTLVTDFGVDSSFFRESINVFSETVTQAMESKPDYAALIKQVWQNFIAYLGVSDYGAFSAETYTSEFYLVTVAKMLCANILEGHVIISSDEDIKQILNGEYFTRQNIYNLIDYDYFGWLNDNPYVNQIIPCAKEIQKRLQAYDFSLLVEQDIFGKLLAQLADREHRLMLGQEFTPHWIARDIVNFNIQKLGTEAPRIIDMCCGSGVFLIESIKAVREKHSIVVDNYDQEKDNILFSCVMGFDIDPLAVMLAKVNWIMAMRDYFSLHSGSITVPIYHADSLFVTTPIAHRMPTEDDDHYVLKFDEHEISLPVFLLSPSFRKVFDSFMSKVYRLAMARASIPKTSINEIDSKSLINAVEIESGSTLSEKTKNELCETAIQMVTELENLQRQGRNGIWHFIISNSYRPGLSERQFNCIVSNPPWMAMSKLAENPYKNSLRDIAERYSIQPRGAAHPHMELASIFLVSSVDRYLKEGGHWSCIMPASLMSGLNHEPFRQEQYKTSSKRLDTNVSALWELPTNLFKNKAIVLSGEKERTESQPICGRVYQAAQEFTDCIYTLNRQGNRSAWTNRGTDTEVADVINNGTLSFIEGCDLFPRTVLFHNFIKRADGNYNIQKIERTDDLWYLVSENKKDICVDLVAENIDKEYMYDAFISKHLSPFIVAEPAHVLLPGRKEQGTWEAVSTTDIAIMNASTSFVFNQISEAMNQDLESYLKQRINIREKLFRQEFESKDWLIVSNASGANPCAAYLDLTNCNRERLVIDQTLYWHLADSEAEAIFIVGLLNSSALSDAIHDFQPDGGHGKRHIHTLPYKILPIFNPSDEAHQEVVEATKQLINEWKTKCNTGIFHMLINPNSGPLNSRRKKQQKEIKNLPSYQRYNKACSSVF